MITRYRKTAAALGATALGATGLVLMAPAASAGTVEPQVTCVAPAPIGTKTAPMKMTVTGAADPVLPGSTLALTVDPGLSPIGSPFPLPKVDLTSTFKFELSGAATGPVEWVVQKYMDPLPTGQIDADPFDVQLTVPANATAGQELKLTWKDLINKTVSDGTDFGNVPCTPGDNNGVVFSVQVKEVPAGTVTLAATPNTVAPKGEIALDGVNWTASVADAKPSLCDKDGNNCDEAKFKSDTLKTDAEGKLSGKAVLADSVVAGEYQVQVSDGTKQQKTKLLVKAPEQPKPTITADPATGKSGDKTTVKGTNFTADAAVDIVGVKADGSTTDDKATGKVKADGTFAIDLVVKDKGTVKVKATADGKSAEAGYTVQADDPVVTDPNGKEVSVSYACKTLVDGKPFPGIPDSEQTLGIKILVPSAAKAKDKVDILAEFKDGKLGSAPSITPANQQLTVETAELTVDIVEGGTEKGTAKASLNGFTVTANPGQPLTAPGALKGQWEVWGGGDFTFSPGTLVLKTVPQGLPLKSETTCTVKSSAVSATMKASGDKGTPPAGGGTSTATGGGLAKTGSDGTSVNAFALVAGTAVLAAVGVLLMLPRRRRRLQARG
ncbi:hypothetical protein [Yinghuangia soli]|uniref:LPXTG cell wall anchor domain-containing protein n=1 Tax=Yinghuangia soli TaxID=2908204 RepID=A0AA41Q9F9_9ACTN|nr:hypothetical protein [Yinghuangia soli]MCF2534025.1 hypothetical protein [Yinghuangia soli]